MKQEYDILDFTSKLSKRKLDLMLFLYSNNNCTLNDCMAYMKSSRQYVWNMLNSLTSEKLVEQRRKKKDMRIIFVNLSSLGVIVIKKIIELNNLLNNQKIIKLSGKGIIILPFSELDIK